MTVQQGPVWPHDRQDEHWMWGYNSDHPLCPTSDHVSLCPPHQVTAAAPPLSHPHCPPGAPITPTIPAQAPPEPQPQPFPEDLNTSAATAPHVGTITA